MSSSTTCTVYFEDSLIEKSILDRCTCGICGSEDILYWNHKCDFLALAERRREARE